ncbi:MAG TPA: ABC transporter substrate-binding protein [candidate division Zixibacteria bacterium]|nr:ABC transporter substrate-binding protein [candidate division Zixibacteria bacterium]
MSKNSVRAGIGLLGLFLCAEAPAQERLRLAYSAISGAMLTPWVARESGIFGRNNLAVELVYIAGGSATAAALLGGDIQIMLANGEVVVRSRLQGSDMVSFADTTSTLVFSLMARPEIAGAAELRGKRLGITRFGTATHAALVAALAHFGIGANEVTVLQMGGIPQIMAGIEKGAIAGGVLSPPINIKAKKLGLKELLDVGTLRIPYQQTTFVARQEWIRKSPEAMKAVTRSIVEAIHKIKTDKPFAQRILGKYSKIDDPEILEEAYRIFALNYLPEVPYPSVEAVRRKLAEFAAADEKARARSATEFVDLRWVQELESSGFIQKLYRR